jgi:hypothetical protein
MERNMDLSDLILVTEGLNYKLIKSSVLGKTKLGGEQKP